jgi:kinetochore protein Nuf2
MKCVGIHDFNMRDVLKPEHMRFRILLSAVINFAKFREEQLGVFEELSKKSSLTAETLSDLQAKESELTSALFISQ